MSLRAAAAILLSTFALAAISPPAFAHETPCVDGSAGGFSCNKIDLLEHMPLSSFGPGVTNTNDIWGWTDPLDGREYTVLGLNTGTAFLDVSEPDDVVFLGTLPTHSVASLWRSLKVYQNYAFIGSEATNHGLQIFDLTQLRDVKNPPVTFQTTAHYAGFSSNHTIEIDTETGFLYAAGTNTCNGGEHIVDIRKPLEPTFAGCFDSDGYTHEAQCTVYRGPDAEHFGKEICMACNIDTLTIIDVTNKSAPTMISRTGYAGNVYAHQGWLTEDHEYFLLNDELDENNFGHNTKTYIWDVRNLDAPTVIGTHFHATDATDHNLYIRGNYAYETNYEAGLHIMELSNVAAGQLTEVAFFDTEPGNGRGAWNNYPYFESGIVVISEIDRGFFVLKPNLCTAPAAPTGLEVAVKAPNQLALSWKGAAPPNGSFRIERAYGACPVADPDVVASGLTGNSAVDTVSGTLEYAYVVRAIGEDGLCQSVASECASATATGVCNAPPAFGGVETVTDAGTAQCGIGLSWSAASSRCGGSGMTYTVYRGTDANLEPSPANRLAQGIAGTSYLDASVESGVTYFYIVRATDTTTGAEDDNRHLLTGRAYGPPGPGTFHAGAEPDDPVLESGGATRHLGWELHDGHAHTGERSYSSSYLSNSCLALSLPTLSLVPGGSPALSFWSRFSILGGDGGVVQISTDDGDNWLPLSLDQGYPGTMAAGSDACSFATGVPVFVGTNGAFQSFTANLAAFAGQEVKIRYVFSTDGSGTNTMGWLLDDLEISDAIVPGACLGGVLFGDGFESGNTKGWTSDHP